MLTELCDEIRNYFLRDRENDIHVGEYTISGGHIEPIPFLQKGQYFRIVGSVFNDGVWKYPDNVLTDEVFYGAVWAMAVPPAVIALSAEIDEWNQKNADVIDSPFSSESFGGYTYTKASGSSGGEVMSWQTQFASRLNKWRRISVL